MDLMDKDLSLNYLSHCDPRLNYEQSLGKSLRDP
jgi:3-deoxy-7-phosphoheptulonate synthase